MRAVANTIDVRVATSTDDPDLRRLLRENPMQGEISVSLEREPDVFLAGSTEGERHHTIVARDRLQGRTVGMASRSVYNGFLNGQPASLGYLGQLRVDRGYRGRVGVLSKGYALIRSLRAPGDLPFDLTSIVADNTTARRVLGAGLTNLPLYRELEPFTTLILPLWKRRHSRPDSAIRIERCSIERMADVADCLERNRVRYQFAPRWTRSELLSFERSRGLWPRDFFIAVRDERVIGCLALWNQNSFKQIVVRDYGPAMRRWRPLVDVAARLLGTPQLPRIGCPISHLYLSHVAVDDDRAEVFEALLARAYNEACDEGHACLVAGFADRHPFLPLVRRRYRSWTYSSVLYAVCWENERAALAGIDRRVPHLEVGLL
jgi:hypothetical protein